MNAKLKAACAALLLTGLVSGGSAAAHDFRAGALRIDHPWVRATPKGADVGAGYLTIENTGKTADRLLSVESAAAKQTELHTMRMDNGVMIMRPAEQGFAIPPGGKLALEPGGNHVMFVGLHTPFVQGASVAAKLRFEKAGEVTVSFTVEAMGAAPPRDNSGSGHSGHGH